MSYLTRLDCAAACGASPLDPSTPHHLCQCGSPLLARYDLEALAVDWSPATLEGRPPTLWRYREVLPIESDEEPVTLGEGFTPLIRAHRLEAALGMDLVHIKDESLNPTNSFKARGLSVAVTLARGLGVQTLSVPSAGNAANALAAYAAQAGLAARVFMPKDVKTPFIRECELYGAEITLVDGLITDAGRAAAETEPRSGGTTSPRSRSRIASRERRRWPTNWANSSGGDGPTGSSIRPAAARESSACGRPSRRSRRWAG